MSKLQRNLDRQAEYMEIKKNVMDILNEYSSREFSKSKIDRFKVIIHTKTEVRILMKSMVENLSKMDESG